MDSTLYTLCAAAGWLAFAYLLSLVRRRSDHARRAITVAVGAFAVGITIAIPAVSSLVDRAAGLPNLAKLAAHGCAMTIAASAEAMLLFLALAAEHARPRMIRRVLASAVAFGGMLGLFALTHASHPDVRLTVEHARVPAVSAYLAIYLTAFVAYSADIARLCWRFARVAGRPWLRRGLRVTAVGAGFGLAYCVSKATYLGGFWLGIDPAGERETAAILVTISSLLMLTGLTLPAWGPALSNLVHWHRLPAYRRLYPLWRDIVAAVPDLVLDDALRRPVVALRDLDYALTRRMVEIRDGWIAVRPYTDQRVAVLAGEHADRCGLTGDDREAAIEAAQFAAGIRAKTLGAPAARPEWSERRSPDGGYNGELAWLVRVAHAYAHSPVVGTTLAGIGELDPARNSAEGSI
jgi:hypothetical protein